MHTHMLLYCTYCTHTAYRVGGLVELRLQGPGNVFLGVRAEQVRGERAAVGLGVAGQDLALHLHAVGELGGVGLDIEASAGAALALYFAERVNVVLTLNTALHIVAVQTGGGDLEARVAGGHQGELGVVIESLREQVLE
jgi:hypothetical protein